MDFMEFRKLNYDEMKEIIRKEGKWLLYVPEKYKTLEMCLLAWDSWTFDGPLLTWQSAVGYELMKKYENEIGSYLAEKRKIFLDNETEQQRVKRKGIFSDREKDEIYLANRSTRGVLF